MKSTVLKTTRASLAAFLAGLMLIALPLFGCSAPAEEPQKEPEPVESPDPVEKQDDANKDDAAKDGATSNSSEPALTGAISPTDTSAESPAPIGQAVELGIYSTGDKLYHAVYASIDKVTTTTEDSAYVEQCFADHNAVAPDFMQIDLANAELPDDVEICIVDYTVTVPEDFNAGEFGLSNVQQTFKASNPEGGGIPTKGGSYVGMGMVDELETEADAKYFPGNTYKLRGYFAMVKGYEDYVFDVMTYPEGTDSEDISGKSIYAYFAAR